MSRIAKAPVNIPKGVEIDLVGNQLIIKGTNGQLSHTLNSAVNVNISNDVVQVEWNKDDKKATAQAGTARAILSNMVKGVSDGFEKTIGNILFPIKIQL